MMHSKKWQAFFGVLFSGICWYLAFDLSLHLWWALWLAPIPILYLSTRLSGWASFWCAFAAMLIGRLSWFPFLHIVLPPVFAILLTIIYPVFFGLIIVLTRRMITRFPPALAIFVYPVLWSALEFIQFLFSQDGTAISIAYSQSDFLPLLQLASITGVLGICFLVCFIPSVVALAWFYFRRGQKIGRMVLFSSIAVIGIITFGWIRLQAKVPMQNGPVVGMAAIPMNLYAGGAYNRRQDAALSIAAKYIAEVDTLANSGAQVILLPEKAIAVNDSTAPLVLRLFSDAAIRHNATIIVGINSLVNKRLECLAWVISPAGRLASSYQKVKLFEGETAEGFTAGTQPGFFELNGAAMGVTICKDLDFDDYIRSYRKGGTGILYAPAWDFNRDGWFHSRVAMMRAIENGYLLFRNAQQGRLSVSDEKGRVLGEASCEDNRHGVLLMKTGLAPSPTFYSRWGNWLGKLDLVTAVLFLILMFFWKDKKQSVSLSD